MTRRADMLFKRALVLTLVLIIAITVSALYPVNVSGGCYGFALSVSSGPPGTSITLTGSGYATPESNISVILTERT